MRQYSHRACNNDYIFTSKATLLWRDDDSDTYFSEEPSRGLSDDNVSSSHESQLKKICWEPLGHTGLSAVTVSLNL